MLARIQAVLRDAEEREIHDCSVRLWLAELRGVAYQAEDVLDEFYYEVLRSIVESGDAAIEAYHRDGGIKRKFVEMYTSPSLASFSDTIPKVSIPDGMAEKIKDITERFEEIANDRRDLHLREEDGTRLVMGPQIRPPTSSHVDERATFGREEEKEKIISLLDPSNSPDFMVLPIVGMGGFGKTTLAQLVFNDPRIHGLFKRCWVSVSEDFDLVRLTKAIVDSLSEKCEKPCEFSELNILQNILKEKIRGHGLFLVLDDVWNEKRNLWGCFRVGFLGAKFVRILTTTRNTSVANIMQTMSPFQLSSLSEENCCSLFKHFAFGNTETSENANLNEIGRGIVKKCKGSPLAIKALGGILRYEMYEEKWREILESDISESDENGEIMQALRLSYQKLPRHLKPCFLYLSMFPKDTLFKKDMVVRLWMAQGYINGNTRYLKTLEEIGSEYFDELEGRSLVKANDRLFSWFLSDNSYCLHDLIHDLARSISQEAYQLVLENDQQYSGPCKVYHLYLTKQDKLLGSFLAPSNYWSIRTVVKEHRTQIFDYAIFSEIAYLRALQVRYSLLPSTLCTLKHLRYLSVEHRDMETLPETLCLLYDLQTLDLKCFHLRELPENIKNLINLRFFQLNSNKIQQLPESICMLHNLHILSLKYCQKLKELPRGIEQLTRLRKLELESLIYMPFGIAKLTTLKPLSGNFNVIDHDVNGGLGELKDMNKLGGLLSISGLSYIIDAEYSRNANLASKPNLHKLILNFQEDQSMLYGKEKLHLNVTVMSSENANNEIDEKIEDVVLQSLQPHGNLIDLTILNYGGRIFPSWLLNPFLPRLTTLTLNFWIEPNFLPPFGQLPHLRFLDISGNDGVRNVGDELSTYSLLAEYGSSKQPREPSYPLLEVLLLRNMLNLVEWQRHDSDFPSLKELTIENCPKLWKISTIPQKVREITFAYCPKLELLTYPSVIKNLKIHECGFHEIMFGSIYENLTISNCVELISINWSDGGLNSVKEVTFECCPKLELVNILVGTLKLKIHKCCFREIIFQSVPENLTISNCVELTSINWSGGLNSVKEVTFSCCPKLEHVTIPVGILKLKIHECGFREIIFQSVHENLTISNCVELTTINWSDGGLNYVKEVTFECCPKLELITIPVGTLKLKIHECYFREIIFQSVPENLIISNCVELTSINWSDGGLNYVKEVTFECCPKLELVTIPVGTMKLQIHECGFREIIFLSVPENLTISNCVELNSINWMDGSLDSIQEVSFISCPKLELQFPMKDVFHSTKFKIDDCPRIDVSKQNIYQRDSMIKELTLFGNFEIHLSSVKSTIPLLGNSFTLFLTKEDFREEESSACTPQVGVSCQHIMLNLPSLVILEILRCRKVISVVGLDNLSNLKCLSISFCPDLCNWNDKTLPLSLKYLELNYCDKLSSLPLLSGQNHSSTLEVLVITKCPRLDELEDFQGLMKLKTVDIRHCRNVCISLATESLPCKPRINIGNCPLMRDWCQRNNITYNEIELIDNPQDDRAAELQSGELESAEQESDEEEIDEEESGEQESDEE